MNRSAVITPSWQVSVWNKIARLSESIAKSLSLLGREVLVITPAIANGGARRKWFDGIHILEVEDSPKGQWKKNAEQALAIQRGVSEIIVIDGSSWSSVREIHKEIAPVIGIAVFGQSVQGERIASLKTDLFVTEENEFIREVETLLVNNEVLRNRIYNAFGNRDVGKLEMAASIPPEASLISNSSNKTKNSGEVVVVGKIGSELGLEKLLRVMPDVPWLKLKVIGMPYCVLDQNRMNMLVERWHISDRVTFVGWARTRDALTAIKQAEILVAPNQVEYFGYSVLDAMLMKTAVIASAVNMHPELIEDSDSGMLFQNQEELKYALNTLHEMEELRYAYAENAFVKVRDERSLERMVSSLEGLIQ